MSISLKTISSGFEYCTRKTLDMSAKAAEIAFSIPSVVGTSLSQMLPDMKPKSISEVLVQTEVQGSALFSLDHGDVLIEITKNKKGKRIFKATDESLNAVVIVEGKKKHGKVLWEVNVSKHLQKYISKASSVDYGVTNKRWKKDSFSDLKQDFASQNLMKKEGEKVTLNLPGDKEKLVFQDPHAELKAEIVLKHFYQRQNTPVEEAASKPWKLMKGAFLGYVYFSGHMVAPWVNNNSLLSDQAAQFNDKNSFQIPTDEFRSDLIQKTMPSLQQNVMNIATMYAATMIVNRNSKASAFASLLSLIPNVKSMPINSNEVDREVAIAEIQSTGTRKANAAARSTFSESTTAPITIISHLPNLTATPDVQLSVPIDLKKHYELSNPNSNLELSIKQSNGAKAPSWLSMNMGDLSMIKTLYLDWDARDIFITGNYAYIACPYGLKIVDITNPSKPVVVGSKEISPGSGDEGGFISVTGNYAFYGKVVSNTIGGSGALSIYDVSNHSNVLLVNQVPSDSVSPYKYAMTKSGDFIYIAQRTVITQYNGVAYLGIIDVSNPLTPIKKSNTRVFPTYQGESGAPTCIDVFGNYSYIGEPYALPWLDIRNSSSPVLANPLFYSIGASAGVVKSTLVKGNNLFVSTSNANLLIYDITEIANPKLVTSLYLGGVATELMTEGNYIYSFCGSDGLRVVNIEDVLNPELDTTFNTLGSAKDAILRGNYAFTADGPAGLTIIDASKRKILGTPTTQDRGLWKIDVIATDDVGNTIVDPIVIHVGDVNVLPIPNHQVFVGNTSLFTFSADTFEFPGASFTYEASLVGGLSLPPFMSFDSITRTFIFAPVSCNQNTYRIEITANDGYGVTTSTTFDLSVPNRPPVMEQPLSDQTAYTGEAFEYIFSNNSFSDLDKDTLSYSARQVGTTGLPGWLSLDQVLRKFYGTPFGKGVYPIEVIANDGYGGTASVTFTITVPNSAPILLNPPGTQIASIGIPFSYTFNTNTFFDVDNDPLTYSTDSLPEFLTFNPATRTFSGTPQGPDVGAHSITLHAQDSTGGRVSATFSLSVLGASNNNPPVLIKKIPDFTEDAGVPFSYSFDEDTFEDPEGGTLKYQAVLEGGAPLPEGVYFDSDTRTLSGLLQGAQALRITIRALDPYGAFAVDTFALNMVENINYPPVVMNPLPNVVATVGQLFNFYIPKETFDDANNDKLEVSVHRSGGKPLPKWIKWDPKTNSLSGKPGPKNTGTFQDHVIELEAWATDGKGSVKAPFRIIVQGESFWETFAKYGVSFGSVVVSGVGFFKSRALIWNYFKKEKYSTKALNAVVGKGFSRQIQLGFTEVREIKAYHNGRSLAKLPDGCVYDDDQLKGTPTAKSLGRFTIRVYDHDGYINEEFELIIKKHEDDPDPIVEDTGCLQSSYTALSNLSNLKKSGTKKTDTSSSTMMTTLLTDDDEIV
jgi:hypothetical protein